MIQCQNSNANDRAESDSDVYIFKGTRCFVLQTAVNGLDVASLVVVVSPLKTPPNSAAHYKKVCRYTSCVLVKPKPVQPCDNAGLPITTSDGRLAVRLFLQSFLIILSIQSFCNFYPDLKESFLWNWIVNVCNFHNLKCLRDNKPITDTVFRLKVQVDILLVDLSQNLAKGIGKKCVLASCSPTLSLTSQTVLIVLGFRKWTHPGNPYSTSGIQHPVE